MFCFFSALRVFYSSKSSKFIPFKKLICKRSVNNKYMHVYIQKDIKRRCDLCRRLWSGAQNFESVRVTANRIRFWLWEGTAASEWKTAATPLSGTGRDPKPTGSRQEGTCLLLPASPLPLVPPDGRGTGTDTKAEGRLASASRKVAELNGKTVLWTWKAIA